MSSATGAIALTRFFIGLGFGVGAIVDNKLSSVFVTGKRLTLEGACLTDAGFLLGKESSVVATGGLALGLNLGFEVESSFVLVLSSLVGELVASSFVELDLGLDFGVPLTVVGLNFDFVLGLLLDPLKFFGLFVLFPHSSAVPPIFLFNQSRPLLTVLSTT